MRTVSSGINDGNQDKGIKPLWSIHFEDPEEVIKWATNAVDALKNQQRARTEEMLRNRDFYESIQSLSPGKEGIPRDRDRSGRRTDNFSRVSVNHLFDPVEQWVSKVTRFAPAIAILPNNSEHNDRIAAKMCKQFIDNLFYVNDVDTMLEEIARQSRLFGESYLWIEWNAAKGDLDPEFANAQKLGIRVPLNDPATGEPILNSDGEPLYIEKAPRVGDVDYNIVPPWQVLLEPKNQHKDVNWAIKITAQDADELKAKHPSMAGEIDEKAGGNIVDFLKVDEDANEIMVLEIYHRSTEFLDSGRYIKMTENCVLENRPLGYSHGMIPYCRLTNIDVPNVLHGVSFFQNVLLLQVLLNNLYSIAYTNMSLGAHIYWMVPQNANVSNDKLRNAASVIRYSGAMAPKIETFRTLGSELPALIKEVQERLLNLTGIHPISTGQVPPGIEAGIALSFLEEQENQRDNVDIKKHNSFIKKMARMSLAVCGDKYRPEDGRTFRIVGKNNTFSTKALDVAKLSGSYDIRVQRTTALSESKSGRLSQILALEGRFPGKLPWEQVADMLGLANDEKYYDLATMAVQAAEYENERMFEGEPVAAPESWEELIVHWYSHIKYIQTPTYKTDAAPEVKQLFAEHIMATEFLIMERAPTNRALAMKLMTLESFPAFALLPPPVIQVPPEPPPPGAPGDPAAPPQDEQDQPEGEDPESQALDAAVPDPAEQLPEKGPSMELQ